MHFKFTQCPILIIKMNPCDRSVPSVSAICVFIIFLLYLSINLVRRKKIKDNSINEYFYSNNNNNSY